METMRIVVTGAVGTGKSTFVRTASETQVIEIERTATDEISLLKQKTTVAFDFGKLIFGSNRYLHLYGTPGQSRFDFMWDILIREAHAYILLVAANRPNGFESTHKILSFMHQRVQLPMIIGVTHRDCAGALVPEEIKTTLGYMDNKNHPPIVTVNPNDETSVLDALTVLMNLMS